MPSTFKNSIKPGVGTTGVNCYTTPALTTSTALGLSVANIHTDTVYVDVTVTDVSAGVTGHLGKQLMVPVRGSLVAIGGDQKVVLEAGDYITVTSTVVNSADVIVSVLEAS